MRSWGAKTRGCILFSVVVVLVFVSDHTTISDNIVVVIMKKTTILIATILTVGFLSVLVVLGEEPQPATTTAEREDCESYEEIIMKDIHAISESLKDINGSLQALVELKRREMSLKFHIS